MIRYTLFQEHNYTYIKNNCMLLWNLDMLVGLMVLADEEKPEARDAVSMLHKLGIRVYMITGDNKHTAKAIAGKVCRCIICETMSAFYCVSLSYSILLALSACVRVTVLTFLSTCVSVHSIVIFHISLLTSTILTDIIVWILLCSTKCFC